MERGGKLSRVEKDAAIAGGAAGGAYLDSIGKTDLAQMTPAEWEKFLSEVVTGYTADLRRQAAGDIPF